MVEFINHKEENLFLNNFNVDRIFHTIEKADYVFLYYIKGCQDQNSQGGKVYLSALAEIMNIEIPEISKAVENLQNKGYVSWKTDNDAGKTYVELTNKAVELMHDEKKRMETSYRQIKEEIGVEELDRTIQTMKRITGILKRLDTEPEVTA